MSLLPEDKTQTAVPDSTEGNQLFPVFLKLNELHTVLIGAGNVGLEKLTAILHNSRDARVTVIAKNVIPEVREISSSYSTINIIEKPFSDNDLDNADLVIAATDDSKLNKYIRE